MCVGKSLVILLEIPMLSKWICTGAKELKMSLKFSSKDKDRYKNLTTGQM